MDIKTDIEKQVDAGFSRDEIYANLLAKGYTDGDIAKGYKTVSADPAFKHRYGKVSAGSILLGTLFIIVMIVRLVRYNNNGSGFLLIGVFTAFALALYFFTRRK